MAAHKQADKSQVFANTLVAPANGELFELDKCSDSVFAQGMLGPGFVMRPTDGSVYSPANGTVKLIHANGHGYVITTPTGVDILLHLGTDSIGFKRSPFSSRVHVGDSLKAGDRIADARWSEVRAGGRSDEIIVVVSEAAQEALSIQRTGQVVAGEAVALIN